MAFVLKNLVGGTLTVHFLCVLACSTLGLKLPILKKPMLGDIIITIFSIPNHNVKLIKDPFQYYNF